MQRRASCSARRPLSSERRSRSKASRSVRRSGASGRRAQPRWGGGRQSGCVLRSFALPCLLQRRGPAAGWLVAL